MCVYVCVLWAHAEHNGRSITTSRVTFVVGYWSPLFENLVPLARSADIGAHIVDIDPITRSNRSSNFRRPVTMVAIPPPSASCCLCLRAFSCVRSEHIAHPFVRAAHPSVTDANNFVLVPSVLGKHITHVLARMCVSVCVLYTIYGIVVHSCDSPHFTRL